MPKKNYKVKKRFIKKGRPSAKIKRLREQIGIISSWKPARYQ